MNKYIDPTGEHKVKKVVLTPYVRKSKGGRIDYGVEHYKHYVNDKSEYYVYHTSITGYSFNSYILDKLRNGFVVEVKPLKEWEQVRSGEFTVVCNDGYETTPYYEPTQY
jgi:hypothetical protein